tara:strand:+ start:596 stop:1048 length:453 start_codon:yes stop_codon:yes gene_type:complete
MMIEEIGFNINNMEVTSKNFITKLKGLEELPHYEDCKLGVHNASTYVSWRRFQDLNRWWYGENRTKLVNFLTVTFEEYYIFNEMMREAISAERRPDRKRRLMKLNGINKSKMKAWSLGLSCVQAQYPSYEEAQKLTHYVETTFSPRARGQ